MIIGFSMGHETCQILGQVSHNLLCWEINLLMEKCGPGRDWQENSLHPGQIISGQSSGKQWESTPSWRKSKSGRMSSSILKTHENFEGSISATRKTRNSKKPSRMLVRSWKRLWFPLCFVKLWRRTVGVVDPTKLKQDLHEFWKLMNLRDCVWETRYQIIMKTLLQEKETIHCSITILVQIFIPMLQAMEINAAKAAVDQEWENRKKFRCGTWRKSETSQRSSMKQGRRAQKFMLFHWWTHVIWKMPNWRQSTKNTKVELYSKVT